MVAIGRLIFVCISLSLASCFVPVDTVVNIKGRVVDGGGDLYESCKYRLVANNDEIFSVVSSGEFQHSEVLGGFDYNKARLSIECDTGKRTELVSLPTPPQSITEYVDFGTIIIERQNN